MGQCCCFHGHRFALARWNSGIKVLDDDWISDVIVITAEQAMFAISACSRRWARLWHTVTVQLFGHAVKQALSVSNLTLSCSADLATPDPRQNTDANAANPCLRLAIIIFSFTSRGFLFSLSAPTQPACFVVHLLILGWFSILGLWLVSSHSSERVVWGGGTHNAYTCIVQYDAVAEYCRALHLSGDLDV